jgi:hypothetical protein
VTVRHAKVGDAEASLSETHMVRTDHEVRHPDSLAPSREDGGVFLVIALGVLAGLLVLLVMMGGGYAEALPPLAGAAALPWLPFARRGRGR